MTILSPGSPPRRCCRRGWRCRCCSAWWSPRGGAREPDDNGVGGCAFHDSSGSNPDPTPNQPKPGISAAWPALIGFVGLALLLGAVAIPAASASWLLALAHAPGTAPPALIAAVWVLLAPPSGIAAWLIWRTPGNRAALLLWGWHLLACAVWVQCLLGLLMAGPALLASLALAVLAGLTAWAFARLRRAAGVLLLPTLAWTCYVAYVTAGFWWLNRG